MNDYIFTRCFLTLLKERTGIEPDEDNLAFIKATMRMSEPYKKIDSKGRNSWYFTMTVRGTLITVVVDGGSRKVVTVVRETHRRPQFGNMEGGADDRVR